jgi:hypothetical protein
VGLEWVILGIIGWAYSMFGGGALIGPTLFKANERFDAHGPNDPEGLTLVNRFLLFARIDSLVLTLVVLDMVVKPGT